MSTGVDWNHPALELGECYMVVANKIPVVCPRWVLGP